MFVSGIGEGLYALIYLQVFIASLPKFKRWQGVAFLDQHSRSQVKHCTLVTVLLGLLSSSVCIPCSLGFLLPEEERERERWQLTGHQVQAWVGAHCHPDTQGPWLPPASVPFVRWKVCWVWGPPGVPCFKGHERAHGET